MRFSNEICSGDSALGSMYKPVLCKEQIFYVPANARRVLIPPWPKKSCVDIPLVHMIMQGMTKSDLEIAVDGPEAETDLPYYHCCLPSRPLHVATHRCVFQSYRQIVYSKHSSDRHFLAGGVVVNGSRITSE